MLNNSEHNFYRTNESKWSFPHSPASAGEKCVQMQDAGSHMQDAARTVGEG